MQIPNKFVNLPPVSPRVTTVPLSTEDLLRTNRIDIKYKIICLITLCYSSITSSSVAGLTSVVSVVVKRDVVKRDVVKRDVVKRDGLVRVESVVVKRDGFFFCSTNVKFLERCEMWGSYGTCSQ